MKHERDILTKNMRKWHLTPMEKIQVAHAHFYLGVTQHQLATMFGIEEKRIEEACAAVKWAVETDVERIK